MNKYEEIFNHRGFSYECAMRICPNARRYEFEQALHEIELKPGMSIADVPAGGGYLKSFLPKGIIYKGHEPCTSFNFENTANHGSLLPLPWSDNSVDAIISIAGVHHLEDKKHLFQEMFRVAKPGGWLILSDVAEGSDVAWFLDNYVGQYNSTGHKGIYLNETTIRELQQANWVVESHKHVHFLWVFNDPYLLAAFCHLLFDIRTSTPKDTLQVIKNQLGIDQLDNGKIGMHWSLMTIIAKKQA